MTTSLTDPDRLRALARTELMDAGPQESLDRLTRLASRLLVAPVALVSLVDGERQYFASEVGLGLRQTPLSHSFCQHVVVNESSLVVSDAQTDGRVSDSLAISDLGVIAYAGVPLTLTDGHTLGSLCVIQSSPREWSSDDLEILAELARSVIAEIQLRMANRAMATELEQRTDAEAARERALLGLRHAQRLAQLGSWSWEPRDDAGVWSEEMSRIFGRDPRLGPALREEFLAYLVPEDRPELAAAYAAMLKGDASVELEYRIRRHGDGAERVLHALASADAERPGWYRGTVQDITERREAELEAQSARQHAEAITTAMAEGYALTVDGHIVAVNESLCRMTGFDRHRLVGAGLPFPFWPVDRIDQSREIRDRVVDGGGGTFEITLMRADGSRFDAEITAQPARNPDGSHLGFVNTIRDISERKEYEAELERERRDLHEAQAVAEVGSWDYGSDVDAPGRWSAELFRLLGMEPRPAAPTRAEFVAMVVPDDRERIRGELARMRDENRAWAGEFGMFAADGRQLVVAFRGKPSADRDGRRTGAYGTVQDITDLSQRDAEERALGRIAELVAGNAGAASVLAAVAAEVQRLFGAHAGFVSRFDQAAGIGTVIGGQRADGDPMEQLTFALDGGTASAAVSRTGRSARVDSAATAQLVDPTAIWLDRNRVAVGVAAPVVVGGHLWGALSAAFINTEVPAEAERRLARFARLVSMAIANADAWDVLSRQASTDAVTGLANHRTFQARLRAEVNRARRYNRHLSLVLLDLDHFKTVNDSYGHQVGDRVLAEVGRRLLTVARDLDLVARVGGEEFAWLMPETDRDGAFQAAERIRRAIESQPFIQAGTITVSAGVCVSERGLDGEDLVRFADRALYWAKDSGRNTTFLYTDEAHAMLSRDSRSAERFQTMSSVRGLARAIDSKDSATSQHSERVAELAERLALQLGWTKKRARLLHVCGLLHDVGKIGIPDEILLKPGRLTAAEYEQVKLHAELSARIAGEVLEEEQVTWIRGHHERWDGTGYPDGLAGVEIPDGAHILAVADAYDVMTESRTYQPRRSITDALAECRAQSGSQFAPAVVSALAAITPLRDSSVPVA